MQSKKQQEWKIKNLKIKVRKNMRKSLTVKDIFSSVESEKILRSFLLMAMGNFHELGSFRLVLEGEDAARQALGRTKAIPPESSHQ